MRLISLSSWLALLATVVALPTQAAFIDNGDGTVTDTRTGLMWDQCAWGQTYSASGGDGNGQCAGGGTLDNFWGATRQNWPAALVSANTANANSHRGYTGWRLPNLKELESLVRIDAVDPAIDSTAFPNTPHKFFWSSTIHQPDPDFDLPNPTLSWGVGFSIGDVYASSQEFRNPFVRLVRSGPSFAAFDEFGLASTYTGNTSGGPVTATITGGTCAGYQPNSAQFSVPTGSPAGQTFPYDVFSFTALSCGVGGKVTLTLTYPAALPTGTKYWKNINGAWVDWTNKVTIAGNTVVLTITDGGEGDTNPTAGDISDPSGPAFERGPGPTSIPTLSEWGQILLLLLMVMTPIWHLQRRA